LKRALALSGIAALALTCLAATPAPAPTAVPPAPPTPTPVPTGSVRVAVTVIGPDRKSGPGAESVVWVVGSPVASIPGGKIASRNKKFEPRIVVVPAGAALEFPNLDKIYHNVFSLSPNAKFDLGLYRNGASKTQRFERPGLVRVYCNIHPQMAAYVMVVDGGIYRLTGADGTAVLTGVPAGRRTVKAWDERGGEWTGTVDVVAGQTVPLEMTLDGSGFRDLPHTNKHGKAYPPPDDDDNRY
jgi:plastocyanin